MAALIFRIIWLLICWLELSVFTFILYLLSWMPQALTRSYYHYLFRIWCRFFVRALNVQLYLHQKNQHRIPSQYILVANHPSAFEDIGVPSLFNVYPLAKEEVRDWWFVGRINVAADTLFVKREDKESRQRALNSMLERVQKGHNLAIFAEGGCKGRRIYSRFQTGAFDVSMQTGVPILPVFLHYESQDDFEWRDPQILPQKMWHFINSQNRRVNFYLYDAIYPGDYKDKSEFAEDVRQKFLTWQARYLD